MLFDYSAIPRLISSSQSSNRPPISLFIQTQFATQPRAAGCFTLFAKLMDQPSLHPARECGSVELVFPTGFIDADRNAFQAGIELILR